MAATSKKDAEPESAPETSVTVEYGEGHALLNDPEEYSGKGPLPGTQAWYDRSSDCVVNDGTPHMGNAVVGTKVCSRHTMHYDNDGKPRVPK